MAKFKLALYWAASCGGCDVAVLDIHEKILNVAEVADIVLWPVATDFKYKDVEAMGDGEIDACIFNGAIRTSENEHIAHLLRRKSKAMIAFGSCAHLGGIPGLANMYRRKDIFERAYHESPSTYNPEGLVPQTTTETPYGELTLPEFYAEVKPLDQVVEVDYYIPGCPPVPEQVWASIEALVGALSSGQLPPKGTVLGASLKTVCDECKREKQDKVVRKFVRPQSIVPDPDKCLLEQGLVCMGSATRGGCGTRCINANMPCRGCYGPAPGILDQGCKLISAIGTVMDAQDPAKVEEMLKDLLDPAGTFYRFSLPGSLLRKARLAAD